MTFGGIVRIRYRTLPCSILRCPLMRAGRTLRQFPVVAEQVREEIVAPFCRRGRPSDFQSATDRVPGFAGSKFALPAEALLFNTGCFWLRPNICRIASAMGFAEGVTSGNECNRFLIVHGHPGEGLPNVARRGERIRVSIRAFRVHIDQTHLHGSERALKITLSAVSLIGQPLALWSPEDVLFGLPNILAPAAETEGFEAHGLERDITSENHEI